MAYVPVAKHQLPTLIRNLREHPALGSYYVGLDGWEMYQEIKKDFPSYELPEYKKRFLPFRKIILPNTSIDLIISHDDTGFIPRIRVSEAFGYIDS